ncbi:polysaccharide biosynthesis protein [Alicyclobacillus macrosporangiidus]|uniref:polysaccharide biosynthesis protein n=1 Tax=Alicyclobacillus macrosporangiidus TaxID=392015 RepID=UPI0004975EA3|nr:polysaccharide biosynthesis protein [Alicyclobacillus macrosporangiidus]
MVAEFFRGKRILLIGGTGTVGRGLLRALLRFEPRVIRVFSRDEFKQFELQTEYANHSNIRYLLGDVRDTSRLIRAMEDIDVVFHMAALKHVPACEYNPFEAVQTNIIGTQNVITAAMAAGVGKVIVTSTDKAISPTNTYGATKLVVERLVAAAEHAKGSASTVFSAVRFGNVMGSRGSVIPLIKRQLLERRPVTVTDPGMTRFMMTLTQAVELTLRAAVWSHGGELFILKMPVLRLGDLVEVVRDEVSRKYGVPRGEVETIGLRPGEKRYEELMTEDESRQAVELDHMFVIPPPHAHWHYADAAPAAVGTYRSNDIPPIDREQIRHWVLSEGLI